MVQPKYNPQEALERVKLMMNYDLSKTSTENKKVIEEQTQPNSDPYSCIVNFFQNNRNLFSGIGEQKNPEYGLYELLVTLKMSNLTWVFSNWNDGKKTWIQYKNGRYGEYLDHGIWSCNGDSNFTMESTAAGLNFKSINFKQFFSQSQPAQTQPVTQPAQTQPKADNKQDTPDPSKPQKLKPKDSPLGTTLKDTSIPKDLVWYMLTNYSRRGKEVEVKSLTPIKSMNFVDMHKDVWMITSLQGRNKEIGVSLD
jgi:hypothetical protein